MDNTFAVSIVLGAALASGFRSVLANAEKSTAQLGQAFKETNQQLSSANDVIKYKTLLTQLQQKQAAMGGSSERLARGIEEVKRRYQSAKNEAKSYGLNIGQIVVEQQRLATSSSELGKRLDSLQRKSAARDKAAQRFSSLRAAAVTGIGALYGSANVIGQSLTFEHSLQMFGNTGGLGRDEVATVRAQLKSIALEVNQAAPSLLDGVDFLVGKGLDTDAALAAIGSVGKAATATGASVEDLSKASFALMSNMQIAPEQLGSALDMLAQSGKLGGFELADMAQYFPQLTAQAQSLGIEGAAGVASLGSALQIAITGAGDASQAANNFNNFLSKLTAPETVTRFQKMGVDIESVFKEALANGKDPLIEMTTLIQALTDGDKFRIGELFGDMQVIDFLNPMLANLQQFHDFREQTLSDSRGVVDADFANMMTTGQEQLKLTTLATSQLGDAMANTLLPGITFVVHGFAGYMTSLAQWAEEHPVVGNALGGLVVGLGAVATGLAMATGAIWLMNTALLANPITWVVGGLVVGAAVLIAAWEPISSLFSELWSEVKSGSVIAMGKLALGALTAGVAMRKLVTWLRVGIVVSRVFAATSVRFGAVLGKVGAALRVVGSAVLWVGRALMLNPIGLAVTVIAGAALAIYHYWEPIKSFFSELWSSITSAFSRGINVTSDFIANWSPIELFSQAWSGVTEWFTDMGNRMMDGLLGSVYQGLAVLNDALDTAKSWFSWGDDDNSVTIGHSVESQTFADTSPLIRYAQTERDLSALAVPVRAPASSQQHNTIHVTVNNPASNVDVENAMTHAMSRQFAGVPFNDTEY